MVTFRKSLLLLALGAVCVVAVHAAENIETRTATIASGGTLSHGIDLERGTALAILMPSAWTAAGLTFQVSVDGATYYNLYAQDGTEEAATAAASTYIWLTPTHFVGVRHIRIRSGTAGTPVDQEAERVLTLVFKRL